MQRFWDFLGTARNGLVAKEGKRELQQQKSHLRGCSEYLDETRDNVENRNHSATVWERRATMVSTTIFIKIQQHSTTIIYDLAEYAFSYDLGSSYGVRSIPQFLGGVFCIEVTTRTQLSRPITLGHHTSWNTDVRDINTWKSSGKCIYKRCRINRIKRTLLVLPTLGIYKWDIVSGKFKPNCLRR